LTPARPPGSRGTAARRDEERPRESEKWGEKEKERSNTEGRRETGRKRTKARGEGRRGKGKREQQQKKEQRQERKAEEGKEEKNKGREKEKKRRKNDENNNNNNNNNNNTKQHQTTPNNTYLRRAQRPHGRGTEPARVPRALRRHLVLHVRRGVDRLPRAQAGQARRRRAVPRRHQFDFFVFAFLFLCDDDAWQATGQPVGGPPHSQSSLYLSGQKAPCKIGGPPHSQSSLYLTSTGTKSPVQSERAGPLYNIT
jgi:hypothetical protein